MSKYAVALVNHLSDVGLQMRVVEACDWQSALMAAFPGCYGNLSGNDDLQASRFEASDQDWEFDVQEIEGS